MTELSQTTFLFELASADLIASSAAKVPYLVQRLKQLEQLAIEQNLEAHVTLVGSTDARGAQEFNRQLGLARAQELVNQLLQHGVSSQLLVAAVAVAPPTDIPSTQEEQRSVTLKVVLQPLVRSSN